MTQFFDNLISVFKLKLVKALCFNSSEQNIAFESAIKIYLNKPQVVNKWLAGSINIEPIHTNVDIDFSSFTTEYKEFLSKNNKIFNNVKYYASVNFAHLIHLNKFGKALELFVECGDSVKWLTENLMPKLQNWSRTVHQTDDFECARLSTLSLYPEMVNDYSKLYQAMKDVYWPKFSNNWAQLTNTNPEKFIHEDISIACYFILAWKFLNIKPERFVDVGCGNGLLVHILNDQGYSGYGVDMRRRKIWDNFSQTNLIERTIDPKNCFFDDCDWIIGNHSDELSPWLPYIARKAFNRLGSKCHVMLIPCCLFDFNSKFELKQKNESRYDTYLNYLDKVFVAFGFKVYRDKLRIPSTRNVCLIGIMEDLMNRDEDEIVNSLHSNSKASNFVPRDLEQEKLRSSRNCTKNVDAELKTFIMRKVLDNLLSEENYLEKYDGSKWNAGRSSDLSEIVGLFEKKQFAKIKCECGGIKTLLKNYHQLFIFEGNTVRIRNQILDKVLEKKNKNDRKIFAKTKPCLFFMHHPNGCILNETDCSFLHNI
ncbi:putative tRNA (uracil-O(2)-)-methyltransferase [Brachionus plicatilis]|uniref:tRNA (uracil-O(2)-)-methyltransferase n=1 Tax=Brachionus plicatilis TaxID=10195 RepID=A0A3M7S7R8_BRAPC|nr:putative tRNA (uracil-O(2)-)-methyltransferase [Brachionus plicatilis]